MISRVASQAARQSRRIASSSKPQLTQRTSRCFSSLQTNATSNHSLTGLPLQNHIHAHSQHSTTASALTSKVSAFTSTPARSFSLDHGTDFAHGPRPPNHSDPDPVPRTVDVGGEYEYVHTMYKCPDPWDKPYKSKNGQPEGKHYARPTQWEYPSTRSLIWNQRSAVYDAENPDRKLRTGLPGVDVIPNAREVLESILQETIDKAASYERQVFNVSIIKDCEWMLRTMAPCKTDLECEDELNMGQLEQIIKVAEDQYDLLIVYMEEYKPWLTYDRMMIETMPLMQKFPGEEEPGSYRSFPKPNMPDPDDPVHYEFWKDIDEELGYEPQQPMTKEQRAAHNKLHEIDRMFFEPRYPTRAPKPVSKENEELGKIDNPFPVDYVYESEDLQGTRKYTSHFFKTRAGQEQLRVMEERAKETEKAKQAEEKAKPSTSASAPDVKPSDQQAKAASAEAKK